MPIIRLWFLTVLVLMSFYTHWTHPVPTQSNTTVPPCNTGCSTTSSGCSTSCSTSSQTTAINFSPTENMISNRPHLYISDWRPETSRNSRHQNNDSIPICVKATFDKPATEELVRAYIVFLRPYFRRLDYKRITRNQSEMTFAVFKMTHQEVESIINKANKHFDSTLKAAEEPKQQKKELLTDNGNVYIDKIINSTNQKLIIEYSVPADIEISMPLYRTHGQIEYDIFTEWQYLNLIPWDNAWQIHLSGPVAYLHRAYIPKARNARDQINAITLKIETTSRVSGSGVFSILRVHDGYLEEIKPDKPHLSPTRICSEKLHNDSHYILEVRQTSDEIFHRNHVNNAARRNQNAFWQMHFNNEVACNPNAFKVVITKVEDQ